MVRMVRMVRMCLLTARAFSAEALKRQRIPGAAPSLPGTTCPVHVHMSRTPSKFIVRSRACRGIEASPVIAAIRRRVEEWAGSFPMPGFDVSAL